MTFPWLQHQLRHFPPDMSSVVSAPASASVVGHFCICRSIIYKRWSQLPTNVISYVKVPLETRTCLCTAEPLTNSCTVIIKVLGCFLNHKNFIKDKWKDHVLPSWWPHLLHKHKRYSAMHPFSAQPLTVIVNSVNCSAFLSIHTRNLCMSVTAETSFLVSFPYVHVHPLKAEGCWPQDQDEPDEEPREGTWTRFIISGWTDIWNHLGMSSGIKANNKTRLSSQ